MIMKYTDIIDHLNQLNPLVVSNNGPTGDLIAAEVFHPFAVYGSLNRNTLYICNLSALCEADSFFNECNFLCVKDCDLSGMCFSYSGIKRNIAIIPTRSDVEEICKTITALLRDEIAYGRKLEQLLLAYEKIEDVQSIANTAYQILGNPIIISDSSFKILAMSQNVDYQGILLEVGEPDGAIPKSCLALMKQDRIFESYRENEFLLMEDKNHQWLFYPIYVNGIRCGAIGAVAMTAPFTWFDRQLIRRISMLVAMELQKAQEFGVRTDLQYDYLFFDMLQGKNVNGDMLHIRARYLGWTIEEHLQILCLQISPHGKKKDVLRYGERLGEQIRTLFHNCRYSIYQNQIVFLISSNTRESLFTENERYALYTICKNIKVCIGVSNPYGDILQTKTAYEQAQKAMLMGPVFFGNEEKADNSTCDIFTYQQIAPFHICEALFQQSNSIIFLHSAIREIIAYDKKKNTCLLDTLFSYLRHSHNISKVTSELFIHRNTLQYRINKIKEITKLDLNNGEENMLLLLSIYLKKYQEFSNRDDSNG